MSEYHTPSSKLNEAQANANIHPMTDTSTQQIGDDSLNQTGNDQERLGDQSFGQQGQGLKQTQASNSEFPAQGATATTQQSRDESLNQTDNVQDNRTRDLPRGAEGQDFNKTAQSNIGVTPSEVAATEATADESSNQNTKIQRDQKLLNQHQQPGQVQEGESTAPGGEAQGADENNGSAGGDSAGEKHAQPKNTGGTADHVKEQPELGEGGLTGKQPVGKIDLRHL
ncbi:unnamed protein product [Umbelopsis vinacea]|jgi:hypothetical protein